MRTRRALVLVVIACLLRAAVPYVAGPTAPVEPSAGSYACQGHVCGCRTEDDCRRACCCTPSKHGRAPSAPVYSPCGGGGPQAIAASSLVAVLPPPLAGAAERPSFVRAHELVRRVVAPSLEPSTPPPRAASTGA